MLPPTNPTTTTLATRIGLGIVAIKHGNNSKLLLHDMTIVALKEEDTKVGAKFVAFMGTVRDAAPNFKSLTTTIINLLVVIILPVGLIRHRQ